MLIPEAIKKYQTWKKENPDEDYRYDEIDEFFASLSRSEKFELMERATLTYQSFEDADSILDG